jgi:hypothetical protein
LLVAYQASLAGYAFPVQEVLAFFAVFAFLADQDSPLQTGALPFWVVQNGI